MCIVALAWQMVEGYPVCLLSNRDEFYNRTANTLHAWPNSPILAGHDLKEGGTWLGCTAQGKWAVITNFRQGTYQNRDSQSSINQNNSEAQQNHYLSRGLIIKNYLESTLSAQEFAAQIDVKLFRGFNLLLGDLNHAFYIEHNQAHIQPLPAGLYVLSNAKLNTPWPKSQLLQQLLEQQALPLLTDGLSATVNQNKQTLISTVKLKDLPTFEQTALNILHNNTQAPNSQLPNTGIGETWEKLLSSIFIKSPVYGTCASSVLLMGLQHIRFTEQSYGVMGRRKKLSHLVTYLQPISG